MQRHCNPLTFCLTQFSSILIVCSAFLIAAEPATAQVKLTLEDGKVIHADTIGGKTSPLRIELCVQTDRIRITRLIRWNRITAARVLGQEFTTAELIAKYAGPGVHSRPKNQPALLAALQSQDDIPKKADPFATPAKEPTSTDRRVEILTPPSASTETIREGACCVLPRPEPIRHGHLCATCQIHVPCGICRLPVPRTVGLPIEYVDVGVRDDPLNAYADLVKQYYPNGVPLYEAGFALSLMRAARADQVFRIAGDKPENLPPIPPAREPLQNVPAGNETVQRIEISARPISARGKTDWDSLEVSLVAIDDSGHPTSIRGTVYLTLWGQRQELIHSLGNEFVARRGSIKKVASWTRFVNSLGDVRPTRLVVAFPQPIPDHDTRIAALGELHAKLVAGGDGVFETTQRDVVLRRVSGLRNQNLVETGSRFFPQEGTSGGRRNSGYYFHGTTSLRPRGGIFTIKP